MFVAHTVVITWNMTEWTEILGLASHAVLDAFRVGGKGAGTREKQEPGGPICPNAVLVSYVDRSRSWRAR